MTNALLCGLLAVLVSLHIVKYLSLGLIHGNWSRFSDWSNCSTKCGGGFEFRYRTCTNPIHRNGGKQCTGNGVETRACNTHECPPKQCSVDHLVKFVIDVFPNWSFEVNNQFIGALRQVIKGIETAKGIPRRLRLEESDLTNRIKISVHQEKYNYGRTILGFLLQRLELCYINGPRIILMVKDSLGEDRFKDFLALRGNVSLVFTLDTTESMSQEIPQARALAKTLNSYNKRSNVQYILSTYNDPDSGMVKRFINKDKGKFDNAISRLSAAGGGDCEEPTFEGIIKAIDQGAPYSTSSLYVFTDAPSKVLGHRSGDLAVALARDYLVAVNFFFSPYGCGNPRTDIDYGRVADETGGLRLSFTSPQSFRRAADIIEADLDGTTIVKSGRYRGNKYRTPLAPLRIEFPVDKTIRRLIVSVLGLSNMSAVTLFDSCDNRRSTGIQMFDGLLWVVDNPVNGSWTLLTQPDVRTFSYVIKASNFLNIDFDLIFVRKTHPSKQQVRISNPLQGEKAIAKVIIPQLSRLKKSSLQLHLVDKNGTPTKSLVLSDQGEIKFTIPGANPFKIRLTGVTSDGETFMRTSTTIRPLKAIIRMQILRDILSIRRGRISYLRAVIDYAAEKPRMFRLIGHSFTRGIKLTMRKTVLVTKARPGLIPVFVVTRFKVPPGTVARIHITAKSHDIRIHLLANLMVT